MDIEQLRQFLPTALCGVVESVKPITMGLSGAAVYDVTTTTGAFILRIHGDDQDAWARSIAVKQLVSDAGIAPRLVHVDREAKAAVFAKIVGKSFGAAAADPSQRPLLFKSLMERLASLHALPADGIEALDPVGFAKKVWKVQSARPGFPSWAAALGERLPRIEQLFASDPRLCLSHCDLNPANMLWDGSKVWLVDWEQAGRAHPYLDLATIANFLILPDEAALGLLAQQEKMSIDPKQRLMFVAVRDLSRIAFGCVFLGLVPDLTATPIASRDETPVLGQLYGMMATGAVVMSEPKGQALFGAAFLKQCEV